MDRERARELFSAYRDGELRPEEVVALEALLQADAECKAEYEQFCRALSSIAGLAREQAPVNFLEKVQTRLQRRSAGRFYGSRALSPPRMPYELFSLVLILVVLTLYLLSLPIIRVTPEQEPQGPDGVEEEG